MYKHIEINYLLVRSIINFIFIKTYFIIILSILLILLHLLKKHTIICTINKLPTHFLDYIHYNLLKKKY